MGGDAYLNVRDMTCTGRISQFGHSGEMEGFEHFQDYVEPPDMSRTENLPQRNIIEVYNKDMGWTLDRGGVAEAPTADLIRFEEGVKKDLGNILRHRIHEPDMIFRYAGIDIVDLHEVEWVELTDSEDRTLRIAIDRSSHLPLRRDVEQRNEKTRVTTKEMDLYSNYHPIDGIQTAFSNRAQPKQHEDLSGVLRFLPIQHRACPLRSSRKNRSTTAGKRSARGSAQKKRSTRRRKKRQKLPQASNPQTRNAS